MTDSSSGDVSIDHKFANRIKWSQFVQDYSIRVVWVDRWVSGEGGWMDGYVWVGSFCMHAHTHANLKYEWLSPVGG